MLLQYLKAVYFVIPGFRGQALGVHRVKLGVRLPEDPEGDGQWSSK